MRRVSARAARGQRRASPPSLQPPRPPTRRSRPSRPTPLRPARFASARSPSRRRPSAASAPRASQSENSIVQRSRAGGTKRGAGSGGARPHATSDSGSSGGAAPLTPARRPLTRRSGLHAAKHAGRAPPRFQPGAEPQRPADLAGPDAKHGARSGPPPAPASSRPVHAHVHARPAAPGRRIHRLHRSAAPRKRISSPSVGSPYARTLGPRLETLLSVKVTH